MGRERSTARNQRPMKADSLTEVQATAKNMMLENTRISGEVLKGWMDAHPPCWPKGIDEKIYRRL